MNVGESHPNQLQPSDPRMSVKKQLNSTSPHFVFLWVVTLRQRPRWSGVASKEQTNDDMALGLKSGERMAFP